MNFYNDNDPKVCTWLRELIAAKLIPDGIVDQRSITEIKADELKPYTQCHFFAGIGGWPYALRLAGVPDSVRVWTGSCPCQPFSCAGKHRGHEDERHLWPAFRRLISQCNPRTVFGEQVASADGRDWLASVRFDLENIEYWRRYYESLHEVQEAAKTGRLPEILGKIIGRIEANLSGLPETIREEVAQGTRGTVSAIEREAEGQRGFLPSGIRQTASRCDAGERSGETMPTKGIAVRSSEQSCGTGVEGAGGPVRIDRATIRLPREGNGMEQSVASQDAPGTWVHAVERQGDLFLPKRRLGQLGGIGAEECCRSLVGKEPIDDERRIAEVFERCIADSVERIRLAGVRSDLEDLGYVVGAADLCAAGVGAPHIRQRLFWGAVRVGDARLCKSRTVPRDAAEMPRTPFAEVRKEFVPDLFGGSSSTCRLGHSPSDGREQRRAERVAEAGGDGCGVDNANRERCRETGSSGSGSGAGGGSTSGERLADDCGEGLEGRSRIARDNGAECEAAERDGNSWSDSAWIECRDGKARRIPIESGFQRVADGLFDCLDDHWTQGALGGFPLAHKEAFKGSRVGLLRGAGNAIVPQVAEVFVRAFMEIHVVKNTQGATVCP